jgi:hypothetical protein
MAPAASLPVVGALQATGRFAASLHHTVADSKGNLYTGEAATRGRIEKLRVKP